VAGGGVDTAGDSFRDLAIDFKTSWKGSMEDGCDILGSGSFLTGAGGGAGAFLKLGSFGLGFGAEKNEESDLASLTAVAVGLASFLTLGFDDDAEPTAGFFKGGGAFERGGSLSFRFFPFESACITLGATRLHRNELT
jgi:hypothetical protein